MFDLRAVSLDVRRCFDERQGRGELALGVAVAPALVQRHGIVITIRLLPLGERAGALEGAHRPAEIARPVQPFAGFQQRRVRQLGRGQDRCVPDARLREVARVEGAVGVGEDRGGIARGLRGGRGDGRRSAAPLAASLAPPGSASAAPSPPRRSRRATPARSAATRSAARSAPPQRSAAARSSLRPRGSTAARRWRCTSPLSRNGTRPRHSRTRRCAAAPAPRRTSPPRRPPRRGGTRCRRSRPPAQPAAWTHPRRWRATKSMTCTGWVRIVPQIRRDSLSLR